MDNFTGREQLIRHVDNLRTRRVLRRHGIGESVSEICELVYDGDRVYRTQLTTRLLEISDDLVVEELLLAAYSGYVGGLVKETRSELSEAELWSLGLCSLGRAIRSAALCGGSDWHIIRSAKRDFVRAMRRHRAKLADQARFIRMVRETAVVEPSTSIGDELCAVTIEELVEWLCTEFDANDAVARMVVATRLGGFALGPKGASTQRAHNCRERQRVEAQVRGFVSPAEGLAERVLQLAS